jgi:MFS transporter, UMF1 family
MMLQRLGLHRRELRAWAIYDWANSAFWTTVIVAVFPPFFSDYAAALSRYSRRSSATTRRRG